MKKPVTPICIFIIPLLVIVSSTGCIKRDVPAGAAPGNGGTETPRERVNPEEKVSSRTEELTEQPDRTLQLELNETPAEEQVTETPKDPVLGKDFLLVRMELPGIVPEDMVIGGLQDRYVERMETRAVYETIDTFLQSLTEAEIESSTLHPEWEPTVTRALSFFTTKGIVPDHFRIGEIHIGEGSSHANIRLLTEYGRAEGEIYLEPADAEWMITDVQFDLGRLEEPYTDPGQFEPGVYRWLNYY
jgi:hypothetical protein